MVNANLSGDTQRLKTKAFDGPAELHVLDEGSFQSTLHDPAWLESGGTSVRKVGSLELPPYAAVRIHGG